MTLRNLVLVVPLLCLPSCVKENRMDCPCRLDLTMSGGEESIVTMSLWDGTLIQTHQFNTLGGRNRQECEITRGTFILTASSGLTHSLSENGVLTICDGEQMDELFSVSREIDVRGDDASESVLLHKQFAILNMNVIGRDASSPVPVIKIKSRVNGIDITTLSPLSGEYVTELPPLIGGRFRTVLPRQIDDSLSLLADGFGIPIGEYVVKAGYDWTEEDLKDLEIDVDLLRLTVSVTIRGWKEKESFDIVI